MSEDCPSCDHSHHHKHALHVESISVRYHKNLALEDVSFDTQCGHAVALLGPNGAGKSTLLKTIAGLIPRSAGIVRWRNQPVKKWSREFAYLPQSEEVNWDFPITVRGMVEMGRYPQLGAFKKFSSHDEEVVDHALELMHMAELGHRQINELSGGQKQRAFLARAIAQEAHVMLLDEPFTGLDREHSAQLQQVIRQLTKDGRLIIASHHDLNTAEDIFDQAMLLKRNIHAFGATKDVLTNSQLDALYKS
ncbi:ABC transporter ATP-binding protein [Persicirhabdus sediminis]|uniref:metal ABC transporter ATP-binding protein n=1 Tax=Persicirhabdus sediminis TaxID=454144 RepID=UPI002D80EF79|nr:ABC transporter ATP-binding protein [Persicirhabdus sediminis]